jgi:N-glycosylase/DNA lyase
MVFKEIKAMQFLFHKNVVRYYSCWVEASEPKKKTIEKVVKRINQKKKQLDKQLKEDETEDDEDEETESISEVLSADDFASSLLGDDEDLNMQNI